MSSFTVEAEHALPRDVTIPYLSIVIPLYNEADSVGMLRRELSAVLQQLPYSYEVIIVDDGSTDGSFEALRAIHQEDPCWRIIRFRRNFGQTASLSAGFEAAQGSIVITMDADLQNDPGDIPKLIDKLEEGFDIVSGWRVHRKEPMFSRRLPSIIANRLISSTTHISLHDYGCTLKAYRREVVKNIRLYGELHRFIPAIASWMGVTVAEVPVNDRERRFGRSKYGIWRTIRVLFDLITVSFLLKFATRPLHVFGSIGFVMGSLGLLISLYLGFTRIVLGESIAERPLLLLGVVLIILGIQMLSTGLVAEIVMRTYHEERGRPTYMIREDLNNKPVSLNRETADFESRLK